MEITARVGRNEPCPCGSGKKYKVCCEKVAIVVAESKRSPFPLVGVIVVVLVIAGVVALRIFGEDDPTPKTPTTAAVLPTTFPPAPVLQNSAGAPGSQPPGPAPLGKVWSPEHGHWHDAPSTSSPNAPLPFTMDANGSAMPGMAAPAVGAFTPQPPGPVPAGKVWSPDHGHWHDVAPGSVTPQ